MADAPRLYYVAPEQLIAELKAEFEIIFGREILPSQAEYGFLQAMVYEEMKVRAAADSGVASQLLSFSNAPMLDLLAGDRGITRLDAVPSVCTLRFNINPGHGSLIIPQGTRVSTGDGKVVFSTDLEVGIASDVNVIDIKATASIDGSLGNNYPIGTVNVLNDPLAFVSSVVNIDVTSAGSSQESDEQLRARAILALSKASNAGPTNAYKAIAREANPLIIDVEVTKETDGQVNIYPLISGGTTTPQSILDAVYSILSPDDVRPNNDTVVVISPTRIEYQITYDVVLKAGAIQSVNKVKIEAGLTAYANQKARELGGDITLTQLTAAAYNDDISSITFRTFADLHITPKQFAFCTMIAQGNITYENINA